MPQLIKNGEIQDDNWLVIEKDAELTSQQLNGSQKLILPLSTWLAHSDQLENNPHVGLWLDCDEEPNAIGGNEASITAQRCKSLPIIAINFSTFTDGRGYSYARQLRDRYSYQAELRAIGDIQQDQLFFYQRCGFDSFAVREDRDIKKAINSLQDFSVVYQSTNDNTMPAFRRRS